MKESREKIRECIEWLQSPDAKHLWNTIDTLKERNTQQIKRKCVDAGQANEVLALVRENMAYDKVIAIRDKND